MILTHDLLQWHLQALCSDQEEWRSTYQGRLKYSEPSERILGDALWNSLLSWDRVRTASSPSRGITWVVPFFLIGHYYLNQKRWKTIPLTITGIFIRYLVACATSFIYNPDVLRERIVFFKSSAYSFVVFLMIEKPNFYLIKIGREKPSIERIALPGLLETVSLQKSVFIGNRISVS